MLFKNISNGKCYFNKQEITEERYNEIFAIVENKPIPREGYDYRLKDDLTWEEYKLDPLPEPELTTEEIVDIILGGAS